MRRTAVLTTLIALIVLYAGSLGGYHFLDTPPSPFEFAEESVTGETVVILRLRQMAATENTLTVDVLVHPGPELQPATPVDQTQFTVRLSSWTQSDQLIYVHDDLAGNEQTTSLIAVGNPDNWPVDSYATDTIGVQLFNGPDSARVLVPARIVVSGNVNGWDIDSQMGTIESSFAPLETVRLTLQRSQGALAFDIGLLLVLLALPATAIFVAVGTLRGRRKFQPAFSTWFAAMLFAVVPLRNLLPGAPPPGAWIDMAIVVWVLIALAASMITFMIAWWKRME